MLRYKKKTHHGCTCLGFLPFFAASCSKALHVFWQVRQQTSHTFPPLLQVLTRSTLTPNSPNGLKPAFPASKGIQQIFLKTDFIISRSAPPTPGGQTPKDPDHAEDLFAVGRDPKRELPWLQKGLSLYMTEVSRVSE